MASTQASTELWGLGDSYKDDLLWCKKFAVEQKAAAEAAEIKLSGEAAAEAERLTGAAEADAMQRKAAAWEKYSKATFLDKIIHQLPEVTARVSSAIAETDSITVVSNNSSGGGGASKLAREVTDALATMPAVTPHDAFISEELVETWALFSSSDRWYLKRPGLFSF